MVLSIAGFELSFGALQVEKFIRVGDLGLEIGGGWNIGDVDLDDTSHPLISFDQGGTSQLTQEITPDKGQGSSITTVTVTVIDKGDLASKLMSPGFDLAEILYADASIKVGFQGTSYPEDYVTVFRGPVQQVDCGIGYVNFLLGSAEIKKDVELLTPETTPLISPLDGSTHYTILPVTDETIFKIASLGPDGTQDPSMQFYVRIDDELFSYTGTSHLELTGVSRGVAGSALAAHDAAADVKTAYRLKGNGIDLALKLMLSGWNGPFVIGVPVTSIGLVGTTDFIQNSVYFPGANVDDLYGLTAGDYVTITGAANAANNVTARQISEIEITEDGSFIVLEGDDMVLEGSLGAPSSAVCAFRSQYDTLGLGLGLAMSPTEVDVANHQRLQLTFLQAYEFDFILFDIPDVKVWIEDELYYPMACYSIPRKGRSSVQIHSGPLGGDQITTINKDTVINLNQQIVLSRSTTSNFANQVDLSYNYDAIADEFDTVELVNSEASLERIAVGITPLTIQSSGLKTSNGVLSTLLESTANRLLGRYQFGAQYITGLMIAFGPGFPLEVGDLVLIDFASLKLTDVTTGNRNGGKKIFELFNMSPDYKLGQISIDVIESIYGVSERYGSISPASNLLTGSTANRLVLARSFATPTFRPETYKWTDFFGLDILIHSPDFTTYSHQTTLIDIDITGPNPVMIISPPLPSAPPAGYTVQALPYPTSTDPNLDLEWKTRFVFLSPTVSVVSSSDETSFVVGSGDIGKFLKDATVLVHSPNYSDTAPEAQVTNVNTGTNTVTISITTGFTITSSHKVDLIGFADGGQAYRLI